MFSTTLPSPFFFPADAAQKCIFYTPVGSSLRCRQLGPKTKLARGLPNKANCRQFGSLLFFPLLFCCLISWFICVQVAQQSKLPPIWFLAFLSSLLLLAHQLVHHLAVCRLDQKQNLRMDWFLTCVLASNQNELLPFLFLAASPFLFLLCSLVSPLFFCLWIQPKMELTRGLPNNENCCQLLSLFSFLSSFLLLNGWLIALMPVAWTQNGTCAWVAQKSKVPPLLLAMLLFCPPFNFGMGPATNCSIAAFLGASYMLLLHPTNANLIAWHCALFELVCASCLLYDCI